MGLSLQFIIKNLEDEDSSMNNVTEMKKKWLDENMEKYRIEQM